MSSVIQDIAVEKALKELAPVIAQLSGAVQDLLYKVPSAPEEQGAYILKATVDAEGAVVYEWVSAE